MAPNRFTNKTFEEFEKINCNTILGYEDSPVLRLKEAVDKIVPPIPSLMDCVTTALKKSNRSSSLLTRDESASIYLYTMPSAIYSPLNKALRAEDRQALKPWFAFLKIFMTALEKLPSTKDTVWRGLNLDDTLTYVDDDVHVWWSVNSCSMDPSVVKRFIGDSGTIFVIDAIHAKDISAFSAVPDEKEVVLMPGTRVRRRYETLNLNDSYFILRLEEINPQRESIYLFDLIKQTYIQNKRLHRIMNPSKSFPIDKSYINLMMVKVKDQHEKEEQLQHVHTTGAVMDTYEEIYGDRKAINVESIFALCKDSEKQVLVLGRAGIGKSTFCQYVSYQWAKGALWSQYELLALISLRNLTEHRYPPVQNYSLADLVKKEVFSFELPEKEDKLFRDHFDSKKTLWILDGYDEIIQNIPPHLKYLFEQLLKTPHHILTSRPYLNTLSYDVQMEVIGFVDQNIREYVKLFYDQMQDELDDALIRCTRLMEFLRSNKSVWGVAHIPINLELICSVWSNKDWSETEELTITSLYTTMVEWLCRRYLTAQNIDIRQLSDDAVYRRCQREISFLESLAFNAMKNNTIIIRPTLLKSALIEAEIPSENHSNFLNTGILKSFSKQGIGTQIETKKDHYFIHLSFQEYFTALYLVNALKSSSNEEIVKFINRQKYNQRFALVFTFVFGILSETQTNSTICLLWNTLLQDPSDIVGIRHMQLIISGLEATSDKSNVLSYSELLSWIAKCIHYNISNKNYIILNQISPSLNRAQSVVCHHIITDMFVDLLQCDDPDQIYIVLSFIVEIKLVNPSSELISAIAGKVDHTNEMIRFLAISLLDNIDEKIMTSETVDIVLSALKDKNNDVRGCACEVLGNMSEKGAENKVINELMMLLADNDSNIRASASIGLAKIALKTVGDKLICKLANMIEDMNEYLREGACDTLGLIGEKAATDEVISKVLHALDDNSELVRTSACKAIGKMTEKASKAEVINKLITTLGDTNPDVRRSSCEALSMTCNEAKSNKVINEIINQLGDENKDVRMAAITALWRISYTFSKDKIIDKLADLLNDNNKYVRESALDALMIMDSQIAMDRMNKTLLNTITTDCSNDHQNPDEALEFIGENDATSEVISNLLNAVGDANDYIRFKACQTLHKINGESSMREIITQLLRGLEDSSDDTRKRICYAIGALGKKVATDEVVSKLLAAIDDKSEQVRAIACEAFISFSEEAKTNRVMNRLINALEDTSHSVRLSACVAIGNTIGTAATSEIINKLIQVLGDDNEEVRWRAYDALCKIGQEAETNEVLIKLVGALGHEIKDARWRACEALKILGEKIAMDEVIAELAAKLDDNIGEVVLMVCEVLEKIGGKAATNEVIKKLVVLSNHRCAIISPFAEQVCVNLLGSSNSVKKLDSEVLSAFCQLKGASRNLKYMSVEQLMKIISTTKNIDLIAALTRCTFLNGTALTLMDNKIVVYDNKDPCELPISCAELCQQLVDTLIRKRDQFQLSFKMSINIQ